ncbi:DNA mismatch repair protein [Pelobium manganitolerans]|uniref:DNA mismatch repair protein n=1 Tax=Pelobium manganitolerans TaxID=1842495 RepID=A0A419SAL2_9SPHI|nr:cellulase family glycosylhydrolase [Pelobium manganitolerans]RKD19094.1 DNA mismatch repair protein [Pelobium manganitolerans]
MKVSTLLFFLMVALSLASCKKDKDATPQADLLVSTEALSFANAGETKTFYVKANVNWTAQSSETWLQLSASSGTSGTNKVDVSAAANALVADRSATITIKAGDITKTISVTQSASSLFSVDKTEFNADHNQQELTFPVSSNGAYSIEFSADWLSRKAEPSKSGNVYTETIVLNRNGNIFDREATITLKKGAESKTISVKQLGNLKNVAATNTGVSSDAPTLAAKLKVGWNLGNSLEATSATAASETSWGNPKTSKQLIDKVKAAGFNSIRIPCAWSAYIEDPATYKIKDSWLARVKEVVDYCVDNDMYAIINIHWDGGWLEENPTYAAQTEVNKKQKALWEQIAVYFRDYDEHLIFAGTNEVHANYNTPTAEHIKVQESYNQTFVDAVRATGGRNAYRNLAVQSYNTNIKFAIDYMTMPTDPATQRLFTEVHFYDPYDFTLDEKSDKYLWGKDFKNSANAPNWGQEDWVDAQFASIKAKFVDKGIPVIMGEYGAILRNVGAGQANHVKARNYYLSYVTKKAKENGMIPFYWDNGPSGLNSFGLFNRTTGAVEHQDALDAIIQAAQ